MSNVRNHWISNDKGTAMQQTCDNNIAPCGFFSVWRNKPAKTTLWLDIFLRNHYDMISLNWQMASKHLATLGTIAILIFSTVKPASASESFLTTPLPVRNMYGPMMRFFDPVPESALREYSDKWDLQLDQHLSNIYQINQHPFDFLVVDMELYVADVTVRRALSNDMDISLRLSLQRPFNGFMDSFIEGFHRLINTPPGGRDKRPRNTFNYHLTPGSDAGWQGRNRWELGNTVISLRKQMIAGDNWAIAALTSVKLPTASNNRGWGSGAADAGLGIVASYNNVHWFMHVEGWGIYPFAKDVPGTKFITGINFKHPVLPYIFGWDYRPYMRGSVALGWKYSDQLTFILQTQGGTSPYSSGMVQFDNAPQLISIGVQGETSGKLGWRFIFTENGLSQLTTQDIGFTLSLHYQFSE